MTRLTTPCSWPGCKATGNPYEDAGWCFRPRKYLWLPDRFFCPTHDRAEIRAGIKSGQFNEWPIDPAYEESGFIPLESECGQSVLRGVNAAARRAGFHVVGQLRCGTLLCRWDRALPLRRRATEACRRAFACRRLAPVAFISKPWIGFDARLRALPAAQDGWFGLGGFLCRASPRSRSWRALWPS
jgi:hypothetical protein